MNDDLSYIAAGIRAHAVLIDSVTPDPANVRLHSPRNLDTIRGSLARFRQQTPIVIDGNRVIRKGNGTYAAAKALGWSHIAAVVSDLEGTELVGYAVADNRSGDPEVGSTFDQQALADVLAALQSEQGFDATATGFTLDEIAALIQQQNELPADASGKPLDESIAADVKMCTCPHCGKEFPA